MLEIRQGLISLAPLMESLTTEISPQSVNSEYLVPVDVGFYIRLRGRLTSEFKMAIAYAVFSYTGKYNTTSCLREIRKFVLTIHVFRRMLRTQRFRLFESSLHFL